jgi:hypothetical protein
LGPLGPLFERDYKSTTRVTTRDFVSFGKIVLPPTGGSPAHFQLGSTFECVLPQVQKCLASPPWHTVNDGQEVTLNINHAAGHRDDENAFRMAFACGNGAPAMVEASVSGYRG